MVDVIMDGVVIDYAVAFDIAGIANIVLEAATEEVPISSKAIAKRVEINNAIKQIMKAHGIES